MSFVKEISRITFAVTDTDTSADFFQNVFGLENWDFRGTKDFPNANHTFCKDLDVELQFLEPLNEDSGAAKWFAKRKSRSSGICSIEFACTKPLAELEQTMKQAGYECGYIGTDRLCVNCEEKIGIAIILKEAGPEV